MDLLRRVLAIGLGIAVAIGMVTVGDYVSALVYPPSADLHTPADITRYMHDVPVTAFLAMLAGYGVGAFLGGLVATLISGRKVTRPAMIVGIVLTIGNVFNQMEIPHPLWFAIVSVLICIPLAWCGWRVIRREEEFSA